MAFKDTLSLISRKQFLGRLSLALELVSILAPPPLGGHPFRKVEHSLENFEAAFYSGTGTWLAF